MNNHTGKNQYSAYRIDHIYSYYLLLRHQLNKSDWVSARNETARDQLGACQTISSPKNSCQFNVINVQMDVLSAKR